MMVKNTRVIILSVNHSRNHIHFVFGFRIIIIPYYVVLRHCFHLRVLFFVILFTIISVISFDSRVELVQRTLLFVFMVTVVGVLNTKFRDHFGLLELNETISP